jgi:hypothetical protein
MRRAMPPEPLRGSPRSPVGEAVRPVVWGVAMLVLMGAPVLAAASQEVPS